MKNKTFLLILIVAAIGAFLIFRQDKAEIINEEIVDTEEQVISTNEDDTEIRLDEFMIPTKEINGVLEDVTKGEKVRGLQTSPDTKGEASASLFGDGEYHLTGYFENLPSPENDDFYEGWIVRRGDNFSVISTGALEQEDAETGVYTNVFNSNKDLSDHDFYVLTIEPNDGDPAPAGHILEGVMK